MKDTDQKKVKYPHGAPLPDGTFAVGNTPNGRDIRCDGFDGTLYVQPANDNYWVACANMRQVNRVYRLGSRAISAR